MAATVPDRAGGRTFPLSLLQALLGLAALRRRSQAPTTELHPGLNSEAEKQSSVVTRAGTWRGGQDGR